jgi:putative tryptophan/tyrosine transport system substrate-binding protein
MRRRDFIKCVGGAALAPALPWPLAARAQQSPVRPLVGVLSPLSAATAARNIAAFRSSLRDLGYLEGRTVTLEIRYGDGAAERMAPLAAELVTLKPDVLFAGAKSGAVAAHGATRTIPIVIISPENPVAFGLASSIARPGGNVTGMWMLGDDALVGKRFEFLQLAVPGVARIGMLYNPDDPTDAIMVPRLPAVARALGLAVDMFEIRDVTTLDAILAQVARAGVQALFISQGPTFMSRRGDITAMVARLRLPAMYGFREFADAGGLMSYGPNLPDMYRQAARLVGRILKGTSPAELPIELPTRYELIVNLKAAKAIGFTMSDSFLLLADEVIE